MSLISLQEIMLSVSAVVVIIAYHTHLYKKVQRDPLTTAVGITNHARRMWVKGVIRDKRDILAVQTLRNQVMAATFLASTSILVSLGLLSAAFRPGVFSDVSHALNLLGTKTETLLAGLAAHQGYLVLGWVILAAFVGRITRSFNCRAATSTFLPNDER